jgi:NADPH2:quinone reductase
MRAITVASYGSPLLLTEVADPVAGDGQEIVEVVYAAVNPLDIWVSQGSFAGVTPQPHIPGVDGLARRIDGSLVIANGAGVGVAAPGTYAERVAIASATLVPVPPGVDEQQAAALGVAGVTAWMCVHSLGGVTSADTVLVLGASGGVGSVALQLAANAGATVVAQTSSERKAGDLGATGAHVVVGSDGPSLRAALGTTAPTLVIDGLGGEFTGACVDAAAPGCRIVNFGTSSSTTVTFDMRAFYRKGTRLLGYGGLLLTADQRAAAFAALFADVAAGRLHVPIDAVLPLAGAGEAHRRILAREVEGKILLDPAA